MAHRQPSHSEWRSQRYLREVASPGEERVLARHPHRRAAPPPAPLASTGGQTPPVTAHARSRERGPAGTDPAPAGCSTIRDVTHPNVTAGRILDHLELALAGNSSGDLLPRELLDPFEPIGPPRAWLLDSAVEPVVSGSGKLAFLVISPIAILLGIGRVHDTRDMARPSQNETKGSRE